MADSPADNTFVGARLRAARNAVGMTQQHAATEMEISRPLLVAIEKGSRAVKPEELVRFAQLYRCSVGELTRQRAPVELLGTQLRSALRSSQDIDPELDEAISLLERMGDDYLELARLANAPLPRRYPPEFDVTGLDVTIAAEDAATQERARLGLGDGPIPELRRVLDDDIGIRVFVPKLPGHLAGAFAYAEPLGACIAVNAVHPFERQRWSLAHEYGHFMSNRARSEVTTLRRWERMPAHERFAESFAANFLMPRTGLDRRVHDLSRGRELTPADVLQLAHSYQVSAQAMILRLEDLRKLPAGSYDRLQATGFKPAEAERILGISPRNRDTQLLPLRYRYLAVQLYLNGELTEGSLARYLHLNRLAARKLVHELSASIDVDSDGSPSEITIAQGLATPLSQPNE
jgi:Zn-dependent peptidase ImmA (M78 family)/transcriptional regulator with XRE-family HTH domain